MHGLIELSKNLPVMDVPLAQIKELDEAYWFDIGETKPTCRNVAEHAKLMREVDMQFPIILFSDGGVADGMHRVCRALMDGASTIKAVQFTTDPKPNYIGVAPEDLPY